MKSLRFFVCILALSLSVFGGFSVVEKVNAQAAESLILNPTNFTHERAQADVISLFEKTVTGINLLENQANQATTNKGKEEALAFKTLKPNLIPLIDGAKNAYLSAYNKTLTPAEAQMKAIIAAQGYLNAERYKIINTVRKIAGLDSMIGANGVLDGQLRTARDQANEIAQGRSSGNLNVDTNATQNAAQNTIVVKEKSEKGCSVGVFSDMNLGACINEGVTWLIKNTLLQIAGFLVWFAANIFNYSIKVGILDFAKWAPDSLYPLWIIIRQILSLVIVFVGLYLGFLYILGKEEKFEKYIPWVVMFALFVNFSYPLTRAAIDVSNIVSLKVYTSAIGPNALTADFLSQETAGAEIMRKLGLDTLIGNVVDPATNTGLLSSVDSIPGALMAVVFVLYAAYIFFMVAGIMILRTIILVFLTVASPLLLIDSVIPLLGDHAKKMRQMFFQQLAVGPVFMIMLALTLKFLDVFSGSLGANISSLGSKTGGADTITTLFGLTMMLIMLHIMIKVTKETAGTMGEYATNFMGKVGGFGLGAATGGTGLLARNTVGRAATKIRDSKWVKDNPNNFMARRTYDLTNSVAKSTFDLRNSKIVAGGVGKMAGTLGMTGMGMGAGSKSTYEDESKARTAKALERSTRIKTRYERDEYEKNPDGSIMYNTETNLPMLKHKKGDLIQSAVDNRKNYANNVGSRMGGGFLFRSKKQKEERDNAFVEADSKDVLEEYKKLETKTEKADFVKNIQAKFEEVKTKDKNLVTAEAQSLLKILSTLTKEKEDSTKTFNKEVEKALIKYDNLPENGNDRAKHIANIVDDDVRKAVEKKLIERKNNPTTQTPSNTTTKEDEVDIPLDFTSTASTPRRPSNGDESSSATPSGTPKSPVPPSSAATARSTPAANNPSYAVPSAYNVKDPTVVNNINFAAFAKARKSAEQTPAATPPTSQPSTPPLEPAPKDPPAQASTPAAA